MGAWSEDTFGNDIACDWVGTFLDVPSLETVREAIDEVLGTEDYLDSYEASMCLAACEVIARSQGRWGVRDAYSEELDAWLEQNPLEIQEDLKKAADDAIARILGPDSELVELWDDGGYNESWHEAVDDLRARVKGD